MTDERRLRDRPLRILSVIPSMAQRTGGPATVMVESTLALGGRVERVIVCTDAGAPAASAYRQVALGDMPRGAEHLDIRVFPTRQPRQLGYAPALGEFVKAEAARADLVTIHSLNLYPQFAAYRAATRAGTPYIVVPHGALDPWLRSKRKLRKAAADHAFQARMLRHADGIHYTTQEEAARAGVENPRAYIVPNGVNLDAVEAPPGARARFRQDIGIPPEDLIVMFFGRIAAKKGVDVLIRAFAESGIAGHLLVIGPDDEALTPGLETLAQELGVAGRTRFLGPLYGDDRAAALAAADIWALTSHTENFGNAVLEAMAASCPVVVSSDVNIAREIARSEAGVVVDTAVMEAARALKMLASSEERRSDYGARGRAFAERYAWSSVSGQLLEMYEDVITRGGRVAEGRFAAFSSRRPLRRQ